MTKTEALQAIHEAHLYAILDTGYSQPENWPALTQSLIKGGVGVIQIRAKDSTPEEITQWAKEVLKARSDAQVPLIINDHPQLVPLTGAEGCHIGQDDGPLSDARELAGDQAMVGRSTHSLEQSREAEKEGFDYIGFGPIFATPTKPTYQPIGMDDIATVSRERQIPWFCIGGVKRDNVAQLKSAGAKAVVIVSGLLLADSPEAYAQDVVHTLKR